MAATRARQLSASQARRKVRAAAGWKSILIGRWRSELGLMRRYISSGLLLGHGARDSVAAPAVGHGEEAHAALRCHSERRNSQESLNRALRRTESRAAKRRRSRAPPRLS